jgi:hypothetical protein
LCSSGGPEDEIATNQDIFTFWHFIIIDIDRHLDGRGQEYCQDESAFFLVFFFFFFFVVVVSFLARPKS